MTVAESAFAGSLGFALGLIARYAYDEVSAARISLQLKGGLASAGQDLVQVFDLEGARRALPSLRHIRGQLVLATQLSGWRGRWLNLVRQALNDVEGALDVSLTAS